MRRELLLLVLIAFCCSATAQHAEDFRQAWHTIDSLMVEKDLPASALAKVDSLYKAAKEQHRDDEMIKAVVYKLSIDSKITEHNINVTYRLLWNEMKDATTPVTKAVLQALLADKINKLYTQNIWQNQNRKTVPGNKDSDITSWSNEQLVAATDSLYEESLSQESLLRNINISAYAGIVLSGNTPGIRTTLYDVLAHQALDYYKTGLRYITEPAYAFKLTDKNCLAVTDDFIKAGFSSKDSASHLLKSIHLFQQLLAFHHNDLNAEAFVDVAIERILWVNTFGSFDNKDVLYVNALQDIAAKYAKTRSAAEAWFLLADRESQKADSYKPTGDSLNRYGYIKAKTTILERFKAMPDHCLGNDEMNALLHRITSPELNTVAENNNVAGQPFRLLVKYRNVDTLYAKVLSQQDVNKTARKKTYNKWRDLPAVKALQTFEQWLPKTNDYQEHSVEVKIDALPVGDYSILFSNSKDFNNDKDKLVLQTLSVSELAYMHNEYDYFVVNRETGHPVKDVKVRGTIEVKRKGKDDWKTKKIKPVYTDSNGHIALPVDLKNKNRYGDADLQFSKGKEVLYSFDRAFGYSYSNSEDEDDDEDDSTYEDDNSFVHFFTDRSIYRPGQTVYFKGIVLTKDRKTRKEKLYRYPDSAEIDLNDANGKMIDSMFVKVNEYGSFSGKFRLPQNALTGEFSIDSYDFMDGEIEFNVEEYKRPTFYMEFDGIKTAYRVKDTITISGYIKAYAGNAVDNAKLTYNVERSASFPYPYLFWKTRRPYSGTEEIATGSVDVDANGKFEIRFVAMPDSSVDKNSEPFFNFSVDISVTDANGETREGKTNINIGYKSLLLQITVPGIADAGNFQNIFVTTKNCAGENVPANVLLKVSKLKVPSKAYRTRQWERPDQFIFDKAAYQNYFPNDEYEAEADYHEWVKMPAEVLDTFNTATSSAFRIKQPLLQGWYCVEATTKDNDGMEVKDVRYFQLYDMDEPGLPSPQVNFSKVLNNSGLSGDRMQLMLGTSESDVFAIQKLTRQGTDTTGSLNYINLDNGKQKLTYVLKPTDKDNLGMFYAFIKHNCFYTGGMQVYINDALKNLQITYSTYRNKTEPGSKETWSVQVTNPANSKTDAEVLTAMYDASLDQFKKHEWEIPVSERRTYIRNEWQADNFGRQSSDANMLPGFIITETKQYAKLGKSITDFVSGYQPLSTRPAAIKTAFSFPENTPANYLRILGVVKSMRDKEPVAGVTVLAKNNSIGTTTNAAGEFALAVPPNTESLIMSSVGFQSLEVRLDKTTVQAFLKEQSSNLNEVVVTGYGSALKKDLTGSVAGIQVQALSDTVSFKMKIRGIASVADANTLLVIVDGVVVDKKIGDINTSDIEFVTVLKGAEAVNIYGTSAASGAILVTTKEYALRNGNKKDETPVLRVRKNFNETAFFLSQLHADSSGKFTFSFTMPDALTQWKWMTLAHTKDLQFGLRNENIVTQKTLMVQPNLPRFFTQDDTLLLTTRISNLSDSVVAGSAYVAFFDATTNQQLSNFAKAIDEQQVFKVEAGRTTTIKFPVYIPTGIIKPVTIRVIASAGKYSDGEENTLPVLSNRTLVTASLPLFMKTGGAKNFKFNKLVTNTSSTASTESLTVEYTPDPIWACITSLPYLMEFPHECAEQTFNRFYANELSSYIIATHPAIKKVLEKWRTDSTAQLGSLVTNPELKQVLLNETPWVFDAGNETQQRNNLVRLLDTTENDKQAVAALQKLKQMQKKDGGFAWFTGGQSDRYITQYILTGIARLKKMYAVPENAQAIIDDISSKALTYLDKRTSDDFEAMLKRKVDLSANLLDPITVQYWYMRSMFGSENENGFPEKAFRFARVQAEKYWATQSPYMQGMLAIALNNLFPVIKPLTKVRNTQLDIVNSLKENAVSDSVKGTSWKINDGYHWYESPVEMQSLLIEAFDEIIPGDSIIIAMKQWLIMNKQTNNWSTTRATADACTALLSGDIGIPLQSTVVSIKLGDSTIGNDAGTAAYGDGTGYLRHHIDGRNVQPSMGNINVTVTKKVNGNFPGVSYGAVYWQYFEDADKVTSANNASPFFISKQLFIEQNTDKGKVLRQINADNELKVGDKIIIRLVIKCDRDMEYIHLKDMRASAMEPDNVLSEYKWQDGVGYYQSTKDASTNFFISNISKGTYVLEYPVHLTHSGSFTTGIAGIQCMYAPAYAAHSDGIRINVQPQ